MLWAAIFSGLLGFLNLIGNLIPGFPAFLGAFGFTAIQSAGIFFVIAVFMGIADYKSAVKVFE